MWVDFAVYFYRWFRTFSALLQSCLKLFRRNATLFYVIYPDGTQHQLTASTYSAANPLCILVVYYSSSGVKYRFLDLYPKEQPHLEIKEIMSAYQSYEVPDYNFLALSLHVDDTEYAIPPDEFTVVGSTIFTPTFTRWLCKYYLYVATGEKTKVTFIDNQVQVGHSNGPIILYRESYHLSKDD